MCPFVSDSAARIFLLYVTDKDGNIIRIGLLTPVPGVPGSYFHAFSHGGSVLFCRSCGTGTVTLIGPDGEEY